MKKIILTASVLSLSLMFVACGPKSKKGAWIDSDKKKFNDICLGDEKIKELGEPGKELCECMIKKAEMQFDDFAQCDSDETADEKIATDCADEVVKMNEK
ncbi:MAG TPA: hypothetical protein VNW99_10850 [Cytophagaceae bacterium]|jgi:hypothetical protein|nr:hypothetical protein [Cytophagaceae bacterium]